jgi:fructoselysine 3-epimerase
MKYSFNSWAYGSFPTWLPAYTLDETVSRIAAIGYDAIEIGCAAPHAWPAYLSAARRKELRALMERERLAASSLLPPPGGGPGANPASVLPEERAFARSHYMDVVDLAHDLGASLVLYIAGWTIFGCPREEGWKRSAECLDAVARHAALKGIVIAVEPTPADSNLVETADDAIKMIREVNQPNVKAMFDTYHALYRKEPSADYVRTLGDHLAHVHCADVDRGPPADGPIDWLSLLQTLKDRNYGGYLTMEIGFASRAVDPDDYARRALAHLRSVERQLR